MRHSARFLTVLLLCLSAAARSQAYTAQDYYNAGLSFYTKGEYARSIPYLKQALQMDPADWRAHQVLGYSYFKLDDRSHALAEFDESLRLHPDNPSLKSFADHMRPTLATAPPVTEPTAPPPVSSVETWESPIQAAAPTPTEVPRAFRKRNWMEVRAGAVYASLGDLGTAPQGFKDYFSGFNTTASNGNFGLAVGALGAFPLDDVNAIALEGIAGFFVGLDQLVETASESLHETYQPTMMAIEVKYLRLIPMGGSRLRAEVGGGLYGTNLQVHSLYLYPGGQSSVEGPMNGLGFGGSLALSWEFPMGKGLSCGGYLKGRYATTSGIQGTFQDQYGNQSDLGLMKYQGYVTWESVSLIGVGGREWATIDYSGAEGGLFLTFNY